MCVQSGTRHFSQGDVVDVVDWKYNDQLIWPTDQRGGWVAVFGAPVNAHGHRLSASPWVLEKVDEATPATPGLGNPPIAPQGTVGTWKAADTAIVALLTLIAAGVAWYNRKAIGRYFRA